MITLPLFDRPRQRDQARALRLFDRFLAELIDGDWHKGKALCERLHSNERTIRLCADASKGRVISGQLGYKLTRFASLSELDHAESWLLSQARRMTERATEIRKARNQRGEAA